MNNYMMTATEVANELGTSRNYAYKVIRELNMELKSKGYVVVAGKIPRAFLEDKVFYGEGGSAWQLKEKKMERAHDKIKKTRDINNRKDQQSGLTNQNYLMSGNKNGSAI